MLHASTTERGRENGRENRTVLSDNSATTSAAADGVIAVAVVVAVCAGFSDMHNCAPLLLQTCTLPLPWEPINQAPCLRRELRKQHSEEEMSPAKE
ncbi:unnamed protein product [Protopolystoma xenopodis]|uniref:Uncharacterized protein n=1 Tax=Protopolystoma xenopodis TaxID=117903 RepID=A0A448XHG1_9PLAT|nr:unnamed protein product [Protopolystoma xenopodis]